MIISHSKKFIFIKPRKVAGTSVEVALARYCGPEDVITENISSDDLDNTTTEDFRRNDAGFFNHMSSLRIRQKIAPEIWNTYFKITIVRNPWDMVVSRYFWNKKNATPRATPLQALKEVMNSPLNIDRYGKLFFSLKRTLLNQDLKPTDSFEDFLHKLPHNISNTKYYFDRNGTPLCDFVIRYEHLEEDFKTVCERLGIPYEPLPQMKTKVRTGRNYREMYTPETREWIAKKFDQEIKYFNYTFE